MRIKRIFYMAIIGIIPCIYLQSCKKSSDEITKELIEEYILDGYYKAPVFTSDMVIEINGTNAYISEFGSYNNFNNTTNASVLGITPENQVTVGYLFLKNIQKTGLNTYSAEVLRGLSYSENVSTYNQIFYENTEILLKKNEYSNELELDFSNSSVYPSSNWKATTLGGGGGSGVDCIVGTWYDDACGNPTGNVWTFNSNGSGSFSQPDCNGICSNLIFNFTYTISGSTCSINYAAQQPLVYCDGFEPSSPPSPNNESFTFECNETSLTVTSGTGTNVFTR
jgi:hypothetical protein